MTSRPSSTTRSVRDTLAAQFEIAWGLASHHLESLSTEECLWRPATTCLHVEAHAGRWRAEWPTHEGYEIGPPSIAWTTWHIGYWWRKALDHAVGETSLTHDDVPWPGSADAVRAEIGRLRERWLAMLAERTDRDFEIPNPSSWPIPDADLGAIAAWLNVELTKNAAEIGLVRFLYAVRQSSSSDDGGSRRPLAAGENLAGG